MKILYLNLTSGIAGDMLLAAVISSGAVSENFLNKKFHALRRLGVKPPYIKVKKDLTRHPPAFSLIVPDDYHFESPYAIRRIIERFPSDKSVRDFALNALDELISAEARVHKIPRSKVHFHQLNSKDTLIDILGFAIALNEISPDKVIATPLNIGRPNPATLEIIRRARHTKIPVYSDCPDFELATPTGTAILKTMKPEFSDLGSVEVKSYGFGAGLARIPSRHNILRLIIAGDETHAPRFSGKKFSPTGNSNLILIETNIDDMPPEKFPSVTDGILRLGALDVWLENILMKGGRPAVKLCALVRGGGGGGGESAAQLEEVSFFILKNTTSAGVRFTPYSRLSLPRIESRLVKKYRLPDGKTRTKPEMR